ncbi:epoxide hydrolase [Streptomyces halstedii]|uniref:epoxide hydrolase n=1 Tax=Streptomyces halstedii TaxID=1944 RepID=UPI003F4E2811
MVTTIDGADIHFLHVRSPEPDALPLLITHGWPGSVVEFLDVIGPLTNPRSHLGASTDAFDVVIPSIPGYGLSGPTQEGGWDIPRVAGAWAEIMRRLGYRRYGAQGGDWGHSITLELAALAPEQVAIHLNTLLTLPPEDPAVAAGLTDEDWARLNRLLEAKPGAGTPQEITQSLQRAGVPGGEPATVEHTSSPVERRLQVRGPGVSRVYAGE